MVTNMCWNKYFNNFRNKYDKMSYDELKEEYNKIYPSFPDQGSFRDNISYIIEFFENLKEIEIRVLEFGGFKGELANIQLEKFNNIKVWDNYEICTKCIELSVVKDNRYSCIVQDDFVWNSGFKNKKYNVLVSTHALEHISDDQIIKFIKKIPSSIKHLLIEVPLENKGKSNQGKAITTASTVLSFNATVYSFVHGILGYLLCITSNLFPSISHT